MTAWTPQRKLLIFLFCVLAVGLLGFAVVPLGFCVWLAVTGAAWAAPSPLMMNEDDTGIGFARWGRGHRKPLLGFLSDIWRLGPPKVAQDPNEPEGLQPPAGLLRPVTYQSLAGILLAIAFVFADLSISTMLSHLQIQTLPPFDPTNRTLFAALLSGIFGWVIVTEELAAKRIMTIGERECLAPPAIVAEPWGSFFKRLLKWPVLAVLFGVAAAAVADYIYAVAHPFAGWWFFGVIGTTGLVVASWRVLQNDIDDQKAGWLYRQEQIAQWRLRWLSIMRLKNQEESIPAYIVENDLPEDDPTHRIVAFQIQAGHDRTEYSDLGEKLSSALGQARVVCDAYQSSPGVADWGVFTVSYELQDLGPTPHITPSTDTLTGAFACRAAVISAFAKLKLCRPIQVSTQIITTPTSASCIRESAWVLTDGVTVDQVAAKIDQIAEKLGCEWARTHTIPGQSHLILYFGGHPKHAKFINDYLKSDVHEADWAAYLASAKLLGSDRRPPRLERIASTKFGLDELHFSLPPGLDYGAIASYNTINKLASTSAYPYILPKENHKNPSQFALVIGEQDPLDGLFMFTDYLQETIRTPQLGSPDPSWIVGMGSDGELIKYAWDHEEPHLLIAGGSGSGKSGIINSCLVQIFNNNHPDDVQMWMCEPKNELQAYQHLAHVKRFIDGTVTPASPWESAAAMFSEAVDEMTYRYAAMSSHPLAPQKLSEAREIARKDPEGSSSINFPYLFLVVEECASYFASPPLKDDKPHWEELNGHIAELARKSRGAGIYIIVATQYPTNKSIPQVVKQQCRRLGLKTADDVASRVIIDQNGLERIRAKGRGMISGDFGYESFRGLLMDRPDHNRPNIPDDRRELMKNLPTDAYWPKLPAALEAGPNQHGRVIGLPDGSRVQSTPMPKTSRIPTQIQSQQPSAPSTPPPTPDTPATVAPQMQPAALAPAPTPQIPLDISTLNDAEREDLLFG